MQGKRLNQCDVRPVCTQERVLLMCNPNSNNCLWTTLDLGGFIIGPGILTVLIGPDRMDIAGLQVGFNPQI